MLLRTNGTLAALCLVIGLASPALAQQASPCDSVTKNGDGDWVAVRDVTIPGQVEIKEGNTANEAAQEWLDAHCR